MLKKSQREQIVSQAYETYLDESVFTFVKSERPGTPVTRRDVCARFGMTSCRPFTLLQEFCKKYDIRTPHQLSEVGLQGMLDTKGIGEVTALAASHVIASRIGLEAVDAWIEKEGTRTITGAISNAKRKARRRRARNVD